jgi:hypothetical protein
MTDDNNNQIKLVCLGKTLNQLWWDLNESLGKFKEAHGNFTATLSETADE